MIQFYLIGLTIILIIFLIIFIKSRRQAKIKSSVLKASSEQLSEDANLEFDLKENISSINTVPITSRYDYMSSNNLLKNGLNYAWYPTKTEDNRYIINIKFNKQIILKRLRIYSGLSNANNKFTSLIIKDEVGDVIYSKQNINIPKYSIDKFFDAVINNVLTTNCSLEFVSTENLIIRKVIAFGIVSIKSRLEKLVGKNITPKTLDYIEGDLASLLITGILDSYDANSVHSYISKSYNPEERKFKLVYNFDKIYTFYGLEITQLISGFNKYGYHKLKVYSNKLEGGEEYDTKYMTKIFKDDPSNTDQLSLNSFSTPSYYTYIVYFDNITDDNLILEFSGIDDINNFKPSKLQFFGYDVVFGYYDTIMLTNFTKERISLAEIELIDNNNNNILPSLVSKNKVNIYQSPDEDSTLVYIIKIKKTPEYKGDVYKITDKTSLDRYLSGDPAYGSYALDLGIINIKDKQGKLMDKSNFEVYVTSTFKLKNTDGSNTTYTLNTQVPDGVMNNNLRYISHPEDKNPEITILFNKPTNIGSLIIEVIGRKTFTGFNKAKVMWYNKNNKIINEYDINGNSNVTNPYNSNLDIANVYDDNKFTYTLTSPEFSSWKLKNPNSNVRGPIIFINLKDPVILKAIKLINTNEGFNAWSESIKGLNIIAYLSGKWAKPYSAETPFKCEEEGIFDVIFDPVLKVQKLKLARNFYIAYRINSSGNSECLSKTGEKCDSLPTMNMCNNKIRFLDKSYINKECGVGEGSSLDCKYYQKNYILLKDCINGNKGFNNVGYKINDNGSEILFCEKDGDDCKSYDNFNDCLNAPIKPTPNNLICTDSKESDNVDSVCSRAKLKLLNNKYNSIYKVFDISSSEVAKESYYFPLGISLTDQSLVTSVNNNILCLDEYSSSNDKNNVKLMNCDNNYSQVFRIKNYKSNIDDSVGINKIYNPILDKCLTYVNDNNLVFRNCDIDMNTIQEFNITEEGKIKHSNGLCMNVNNLDKKDAVLTNCQDSPKFQVSNFFSNSCTSYNCPNIITHYGAYKDFLNDNDETNPYLFSLILDTNGILRLITRNFFSNETLSNINLLETFPSKFKYSNTNEQFSYPYKMKIINEGILSCYDKNDKVFWRITFKDNSYNPPYSLHFNNVYNNTNKTVNVEIVILNNNNQIIGYLNK